MRCSCSPKIRCQKIRCYDDRLLHISLVDEVLIFTAPHSSTVYWPHGLLVALPLQNCYFQQHNDRQSKCSVSK